MSRDTDPTKFDPKVHTKAWLHEILEDIYLEYACGYIFYYNMILNLKESGQLNIDNIKTKVDDYTKSLDEKVSRRHKISPFFLEAWLQKEQNDA